MTDRTSSLILDAENWLKQLAPELADDFDELLTDLDREAVFDALVQFVDTGGFEDVTIQHPADGEHTLTADAPLLIPRTRIFVAVGTLRHAAVKRAATTAAKCMLLAAVKPGAAFVGLAIDAMADLYERVFRLDAAEAELVNAVLDWCRSSRTSPTAATLAGPGGDVVATQARLQRLIELGVLEGDGDGVRVVF